MSETAMSETMSETKQEKSARIDRRSLLKGATLAIGAAGATVAKAADGTSAAPGTSPARSAGYRETKDVLTYYKLARF